MKQQLEGEAFLDGRSRGNYHTELECEIQENNKGEEMMRRRAARATCYMYASSSRCELEVRARDRSAIEVRSVRSARSKSSIDLPNPEKQFKFRDAEYRSKLSGVFFCVLLSRRVLFEALTF